MMKKITLIIVVVFTLALLVPCGGVAAGELTILDSSVMINFPVSLTFNITAVSDVNIDDIRLHYEVNRMRHAEIVSEICIEFTPATKVKTQWIWDMRKSGGMPPGSMVDYWWAVSDVSGNQLETLPDMVHLEDNRYSWRSIVRDNVTLFWYQGDDSFAAELMDAVDGALSRLSQNTGVELKDPAWLYIYASSSDLRSSMIYPQEWTGGVAFTQFGIIAIGIAPSSSNLYWGKRAIAHELTHLVINQITFNPYNHIPTWLDEGLAMTSEGELEPVFEEAIADARNENRLLSIRSLASPFSAYTAESILSYAESYKVVNYLISKFGQEKMLELLNTFRLGSGYDEALNKVYGFDMDGLDYQWKASLDLLEIP
jgi:hypothetical protein